MNKNKSVHNFSAILVVAAMFFAAASPSRAVDVSDASHAYAKVEQDGLLGAYLETLAEAGESATGNLHSFRILAAPPIPVKQDDPIARKRVTVHVVQDRGLPRGAEYPTYVFTTKDTFEEPLLIYKTHAGTRIFYLDDISGKSGCLLSAEQGYSDICLADIHGNPAPDLPGLRDDFWSDLMKLLGL
jgi:hypothetical protein